MLKFPTTAARLELPNPPPLPAGNDAAAVNNSTIGPRSLFRLATAGVRKRIFARLRLIPAVLTLAMLVVNSASANVAVRIDLARQQMTVVVNGTHHATWAVSTARRGYRTPVGTFRPYLLKRTHFSSLYDNAPMPHSIFFLGGYAIHGTTELRHLGRPVSHGCVRLHPNNARALFALVQQHGLRGTTISITH